MPLLPFLAVAAVLEVMVAPALAVALAVAVVLEVVLAVAVAVALAVVLLRQVPPLLLPLKTENGLCAAGF